MHQYRFYDETGKTLYLLTIFEPVDDLLSRLLAKKIELTIEYKREVFYEEVKTPEYRGFKKATSILR